MNPPLSAKSSGAIDATSVSPDTQTSPEEDTEEAPSGTTCVNKNPFRNVMLSRFYASCIHALPECDQEDYHNKFVSES